ncbi:MAG: hypothetical protein OXG85_04420 [Chloroflexi bacterium]|nr:hypothetical protein [Chloroflexota bacterium]
MTLIGAYLGAPAWQRWSADHTRAELRRYKRYGVNAIFAEADDYRRDIIQIAQDSGLRFMGGLSCFNNNDALTRNPELHPILRDGRRRPRMNWYIGLTPSCQSYAQSRLNVLRQMAQTYALDGIWLDFIRWPLHWEHELRDDTPAPLEASFDDYTLRRFADCADVEIPAGATRQQADWILRTHRDEWIDFKCGIISEFVAQAKMLVNEHLAGKPLGLDIVPAKSAERERLLGQRLHELSAQADYLSPMLYHHVLGFSTGWMAEILDDMAAQSDKPLVPFVQVDAFSSEDGPFSAREWEQVLDAVLSHGGCAGLIAFTGDMLHARGRGRALAARLRHRIVSSA